MYYNTTQNTDENKKNYFYFEGLFVAIDEFVWIQTYSPLRPTYLFKGKTRESGAAIQPRKINPTKNSATRNKYVATCHIRENPTKDRTDTEMWYLAKK